jgi:hypothetical protein
MCCLGGLAGGFGESGESRESGPAYACAQYDNVNGVGLAVDDEAALHQTIHTFPVGVDEVNVRLVEGRKVLVVEARAFAPA